MSDIKKVPADFHSLFEDILVKRAVTHEDCLVFEQELLDAIPLPAFFQDADGCYFCVNRALVDFLGVEREILLEQGVYPFLVHGLAEEYRQKDAELLAIGGRDSFEGLVAGRGGHEQSVLVTRAAVHDRDGRGVGLMITLFDLSALKEAQKNLGEIELQKQAVLDAFPGTLALLDRDLQIIWSNKDNKKEDVNCRESVEQSCHQLLYGRKTHCADCAVRRSIMSGKIESGIHETRIDSGSGEGEFFDVVAAPIKDASGKVTSVVAISRDITGKMQLERQVRHSQKMEAIGSLAGGIAHDFNNVLTPIIGHAEIMRFRLRQSGQQDQELEKSIGEILTAAKRAKSLVGQILTFARSQEQNSVALYVHPIVKEVMGLIKVALPSTIEVHQEIDTDCGQVLMDPVQLHQVLMNLCTNSFHAMEGRVGILTVRLAKGEVDQDGREWLVISVADTGSGIELDVLPRIFEPYFTTKDKSRGTGMGLAVVHGIIGGYGGRVEVQSEVGVGTTFFIYLPVVDSQSSPMESVLAVPLPARGKEHVLVVDDEEQVLNIISSILGGLGYTVTSKSSSQEALSLFMEAKDNFDLLITDYIMPLLTGVDLCAQVKKIRPDMPVILCTGYSEQVNDEILKQAGVDEFFLKPVTLQGLAQVVRQALDRK
jgi:signal transduction histidine kinase